MKTDAQVTLEVNASGKTMSETVQVVSINITK